MNSTQERSEDLAWLADVCRETPKEAARRLGLSVSTLRKWCERHDPEVMERLRHNEAVRRGCVA